MGELSENDFILLLVLKCYKLRTVYFLIGLCMIVQMLVWNTMRNGNNIRGSRRGGGNDRLNE
jgi:hypothetical protein